MGLIERLESRAKELDRDLSVGIYNAQKYDNRELLEEAAKCIRKYQARVRVASGTRWEIPLSELTADEFAVLEIASAGNSMIAIGRWEKSIEHLVELGLMRSVNKANNYITDQGRVALERHEKVVDDGLTNAMVATHNARVVAKGFAEEAAQKLVAAARASAPVTGGSVESAARNWSASILERALDLLK